jgi:hypothetical protein
MNTDPNPFRESPEGERSSSSSEAVDDTSRDFAEMDEENTSGGSSPMSAGAGSEDSLASVGGAGDRSTDETGGVTSPDATRSDVMRGDADGAISGEPRPM